MCQYFAGTRRRALSEVEKRGYIYRTGIGIWTGLIKFRSKFFASLIQPIVPKNETLVFEATPFPIFPFPSLKMEVVFWRQISYFLLKFDKQKKRQLTILKRGNHRVFDSSSVIRSKNNDPSTKSTFIDILLLCAIVRWVYKFARTNNFNVSHKHTIICYRKKYNLLHKELEEDRAPGFQRKHYLL